MKRLACIGTLLVLLVAAVAGQGHIGAEQATPSASPSASPLAMGGTCPPPKWLASVTTTVTLHVSDCGFDPLRIEATNGHDLTITLINSGTRAHSFNVDEYDVHVVVQPGETATVLFHKPGHDSLGLEDVTYYSDEPGDEGFKGTLTFYI